MAQRHGLDATAAFNAALGFATALSYHPDFSDRWLEYYDALTSDAIDVLALLEEGSDE